MHMVVQGGRGARHGVRDGDDDVRAMESQHWKIWWRGISRLQSNVRCRPGTLTHKPDKTKVYEKENTTMSKAIQ